MTIREEIAEIIRKANLFYHKGLSVEEVADEILNIKREVRCPLCKQERKTMPSFATTVGCQCNDTGYILKTLGEIVDEK